ncbi:MAG TPA: hypothetical protein EYN66_09595, partial [Myxococcales bacterium]|nr:hypothetical protein [Myxococcales bacterium]
MLRSAPMRADQRSYGLHSVFVAGLPLLILAIYVWSSAADIPSKDPAINYVKNDLMTTPALSRLVVVIVDSMGERNGSDPKLMPKLSALNKAHLSGPQRSCAANFTLPCLLTTFEGRESPFLRALNNFSAAASANPNWLGALRDQGRRIAIVSDHTLLQLYPQTYVVGENYETLQIDHDERDQYAYSRALKWVDERKHDVLIIHIIGTDKASHRVEKVTIKQPQSPILRLVLSLLILL